MNITLSVSGELEQAVRKNQQIKWTEVARNAMKEEAEKLMKLQILQKYLERKPISEEEWAWMEKADWHPVDEKDYKERFVEDVLKACKGKTEKIKSIGEIFK